MPRYVAVPTAYWDDDFRPMIPDIRVDHAEPVDTGLLDPAGNKLFRISDEIGFRPARLCTER